MAIDLNDLGIFGGLPKEFQPAGYTPNYGGNAPVPVNAYGVPLDANNNLGLYGQLENAKNLDTSQNGGLFGFASEVLFGEKPPQLPTSISEGILGGSVGDEIGKAIKPFALPLVIVLGIYALSKGKL